MYRHFPRRWYSWIQTRIQTDSSAFRITQTNTIRRVLMQDIGRDVVARSWVSEADWLEEQPPGMGSLGIIALVGPGGAVNTRCWIWEDWGEDSRGMNLYREMRQELQVKKDKPRWALHCCALRYLCELMVFKTEMLPYHYFLISEPKWQWTHLEPKLWFLSTNLSLKGTELILGRGQWNYKISLEVFVFRKEENA